MNDQQSRTVANNQEKQPGVLVRFTLPITVGLVATVAVIPFAWAFAHFPDKHELIVFIAVAATGAATAVSAYYAAESLIAGRKDATEALRRETERAIHATQKEKVVNAFEYIKLWNDPLFARTKRHFRVLLKEGRDHATETWKVLETDVSKRSVVQDILNFFETIELAIRKELADEATLRNYFRSITVDYFSVFESWIKESRKANKNPTGYSEMEELSKRWGQDSGPKN